MWPLKKRKKEAEQAIKSQVNFDSLFVSMAHGQQLFKQLQVLCHPDKYIGTNKQEKAEELFKLVMEYSTNYERLLEIQKRYEDELR